MSPRVWIPLAVLLVGIGVVLLITRTPEGKVEHVDSVEIATTKAAVAPTLPSGPTVSTVVPSVIPRFRRPTVPPPPVEPPAPSTSSSAPLPHYRDAHEVFDAQIDALRRDDDDAFRRTFLPGTAIAPRDIAACKKLLKDERSIVPDWATKEELTYKNGEKVERVEIWTHARTGFHTTADGVFADHLWCAPPPRVP